MSDQVPEEVVGFTSIPLDGLNPNIRSYHNQTILNLEVKDKQWKLGARPKLGIGLSILLLVQNALVFWFIFSAYNDARLEEAAIVISIICTATLVETAAIVQIMVRWIFSDMEYKVR